MQNTQRIVSTVGAIAATTALLASSANCGSDCAKTLTCGTPDDDVGATSSGGSGGGTPGAGGTDVTSNGGYGGTPGVGGFGGTDAGGQGGGGSGAGGALPILPLDIRAGSAQTCTTLSDGSARCWGQNNYGQLGNGTTIDSSLPSSVSLTGIAMVDPGYQHSCALRNDGTVWCVGRNDKGQLGNGSNVDSTSPVQVVGISTATAISVNGSASCARLANATARCWGAGTQGQLGIGSTTNSNVPVVFPEAGVAQIASGNATICARLSTGAVRCAGLGSQGQLGNGAQSDSSVPVSVSGVTDAVDLASSGSHSCVVRQSGKVSCWGQDTYGQIGDGIAGGVHASPVDVVSITGAFSVGVSAFSSSCALLNDGSVRCWGRNNHGQLGNGTTSGATDPNPTPVQVLGLSDAAAIALEGNHVCALRSTDQLVCWGNNYVGQLGNGNMTDSSQPVMVNGL